MPSSRSRFFATILISSVLCAGGDALGQAAPGQSRPDGGGTQNPFSDRFDFGRLPIEQPLEHTFSFRNEGPVALELADVQLTPPLVAVRGTPRVEPGAVGGITVRLAQPRRGGPFEGEIVLSFRQSSAMSRTFVVTGTIVPMVDLQPAVGIYLAAQRGTQASGSIEIINRRDTPLDIRAVEYEGARFAPRLETIEPGRRYRVTATVRPDAATGRTTEMVRLRTADAERTVSFPVNVLVRERVYTFPDVVDMGAVRLESLKAPGGVGVLDQTLMVYQSGGTDFQVSVTTDLPLLKLDAARSPFRDRYQITVSVVPERLRVGPIRGSITITTNDPEFPRVVVPVEGAILDAAR